ncbi:iron complex transport system substrate-binding protein [Pseudobutyrivibrio sp. JW11]|uniref:iron-siderophore ABC transporter substrate-binding protein n=1 Tax=Pseudobutyrivibrio sp. JW11 TaxID=1855302 RepID=UPI0008E49037|nr:iron-siderophore ABC transporter substrate-binding protein [Pseudobutyrivibrio sp. JW11]SFO41177.1 iron complex transport system substrate-binding protein [Pseudobutyrivibrio sp. JW11]
MRKKLLSLIAAVSVFSTALVGCGSTDTATTSDTSSADSANTEVTGDDSAFPITIEHAFGETTIESKPERVVTLSWANQDAILALGVVPVGVSAANYGLMTDNKLHLWTDEAFAELGETNPNVFDDETGWDYEAIAAAEPDVIIASYSGFTEEEYNLLSEIAPVVPYIETAWKTNWRDQTIVNATAIGMKAEGEKLVEETDALISEKLEQYPELEGKTAGFFWISQDDMSTFYAYLPNDPRAAYLNDLGLETPESILSLAETSEDFSVTISRENSDLLNDVDIMIVYGDEGLLEAMQADALMSQIPAVKNGAVVLLDSNSALAAATTPSILSIPYAIDDYLSLLSEAANNINE